MSTGLSTAPVSTLDDNNFDQCATAQGDPCRIWLGCLPTKITEYAVLQLIKQFGPLSDFRFPVHQSGNLKGSTLGYCFVTYKFRQDAERACKCLNHLNFHHSRLIARPSRPTKDELVLAKQSLDEEARLRILAEAKLNEVRLNAIVHGESQSKLFNTDELDIINEHELMEAVVSGYPSSSNSLSIVNKGGLFNHANLPDLYGCLGRSDPGHFDRSDSARTCNPHRPSTKTGGTQTNPTNAATSRHKPALSEASKAAAIRLIESELKKLHQNPIGGSASLQPSLCGIANNPANLLNRHKASSNHHHTNSNSLKRSVAINNRYRGHQHHGSRINDRSRFTRF